MAGVFFLSLALFAGAFIRGLQPVPYEGMPFYNLIFGSIHEFPVLNRLIAIALLLILGNMLIRIGVRYILLDFRSYMPAAFLLIFTVADPSVQQVSPALTGSMFFLFTYAILFDSPDKKPDTFSVFSAGLVLALGSMFCLKLIWFIPLIWISLGRLRQVTWRELVYPVIAYALLALFLFTWFQVVEGDNRAFVELIRTNLEFNGAVKGGIVTSGLQYPVLAYYGFFLLLIFVASVYMINRFQSRKTVVQNIYQVLFYMFIAGILYFLFIDGDDLSSLVFIAFPVSFIMSNYFHRKKNHWMHELILWVLIWLIAFNQFTVLS